MTVTQSAQLAGFMARIGASGEPVSLPNGDVVVALIDRGLIQRVRRAGLPDFQTRASVSIEFLTPCTRLIVGQAITFAADSSKRLLIKEIFDETGYSLRCVCQPYDANA